jgi:NAD+ synthase (glutamine-hydrolysing)
MVLKGDGMRIALAQLNLTVGALDANRDAIVRAAHRARDLGAGLALFSELALPGYPPRDLLERPAFVAAVLDANRRLVDQLPEGVTVIFGTVLDQPSKDGKPIHNSAVTARRGEVLCRSHKRLLPTYDVFDEERYFEPGASACRIEHDGLTLGLTICEDAWNDDARLAARAYGGPHWADGANLGRRYHVNPVADVLTSKTDLLVNISASPFTLSKRMARAEMLAEIARRRHVPIAFVNQVGGNDELVFDGRSCLFGPDGAILARAAAFAEEVLVADVALGGSVAEDFGSEEEAAYGALVLGTADYAKKCGFDRAIVGLSGGIDSALTATIAADALGQRNVLGIAMPGRYSSTGSLEDARLLARNLGIELREISIEAVFSSFLDQLSPQLDALRRAGESDVTLENLQARIRGTMLMAVSNRTGALLLTTGNKSELGVGYCTLYGDMAGGLSVISDVPKTLVYRLARYVNRHRERIPRSSIDKPPSAELRPNQTDQDSLPPYDVLDRVLELYVEDGLGRDAIVERGEPADVVDRVLGLVQASEYKRRQAAPGLILTEKGFGVGRRIPVAQRFRE